MPRLPIACDRSAEDSIDTTQEPGPRHLLRHRLANLRGARKRIAEVLLHPGEAAGSESITEVARRAETSAATVNRLSKDLGFDGYPALRAAIAREIGREVQAEWERDIGPELGPDDDPARVLQVLAGTQARAIRSALAAIDLRLMERLAAAVVHADRVHVFGQWGDSVPAAEVYFRLFRIGIPVWIHESTLAASVAGTLMAPGDVAIAFSRRGHDDGALRFLQSASEHGALTAALTGQPDSPVATAASLSIFTGVHANDAWIDLYAGRTTDTLAASLLWVMVAQRMPEGLAKAHS